jgi:hypothetical protein
MDTTPGPVLGKDDKPMSTVTHGICLACAERAMREGEDSYEVKALCDYLADDPVATRNWARRLEAQLYDLQVEGLVDFGTPAAAAWHLVRLAMGGRTAMQITGYVTELTAERSPRFHRRAI